jgi:hypothetical protein
MMLMTPKMTDYNRIEMRMSNTATLIFAGSVLFACCAFATMMASHHAAEEFADIPASLKTPIGSLCAALLTAENGAKPAEPAEPAPLAVGSRPTAETSAMRR